MVHEDLQWMFQFDIDFFAQNAVLENVLVD
jgi:hypothetical protein